MKYLFDTNVFITAKNTYYATDIAPSFWQHLEFVIKKDKVIIIDKVYQEILKGGDELANWMRETCSSKTVLSTFPQVLKNYTEIIVSISSNDQYSQSAKDEFARVADSWLLAHSYQNECCIVTNEKYEPNIKRKVKIPNICELFHIPYINLFRFMREVDIVL